MACILAADVAGNAGKIIVACLMLGVALFVLGIGMWYYRRWQQRSSTGSAANPWSLDDLRKMREQGQLSEEEYQRLRDTVIGDYTGKPVTAGRPQPAKPADEHWDWVAGDDPGAGGFDMKKQSPG